MSILPNAKEKAFLKAVADFHNEHGVGYLFGDEWKGSPFQIHHVAGRTYKHNKVHIGHYFILPVVATLHDVSSNHPHNVTHYRHKFSEVYGNQRDLWQKMMFQMQMLGSVDAEYFPDDDIWLSIMSTKY